MIWEQVYNPLGNIWISALVAAIPILFFIIALTVFKLKGYVAGLASVAVAALVALMAYGMPFGKVVGAGVFGALSGLYPVATIVLAAIFLYKLTVKTGKFEIIKNSITSITADQRIQVLLVAYCFGAFLEGAAGFGAPVAITAVILIGLGFKPVKAAGLCLVANIAGGSYGAMGIPVTTPATLTDLPALEIASRTSYIIPLISIVLAFLLVFLVDRMKGIKQTYPAILVCSGTFAAVQFVVLNTLGAVLVDILSALAALLALTLFLRKWRPKQIYRIVEGESAEVIKHSRGEIAKAWLPFGLLTALVILFSLKSFKDVFNGLTLNLPIMGLDKMVYRLPPIVSKPTPYAAVFKIEFASTTVAILLAGLLTILIFKIPWGIIKDAARETGKELFLPIVTICAVLAFAYICNYSGMSSTLGLALASTGGMFPLFAPVLGWIGVFLTGSVVNCGSLFAPLQAVTAAQIGISPAAMVAANVIGGDMAKMISPQSVAVAAAAVGLTGRENELFKFTIKISVIFLVVVGIINLLIY
ncbi:lactate permease LctP family transporter [Paenibacillus sp. KQZ6P-2]|uniref:L-lactate permease n=1 Tax=Paenibacillus mangrovi TaxID=2931978 RepID=A0A9X2B3L8_9BACL|nr:lactate permease LctP family transporter [Paenibacillus mangrovi]